MSFNDDQIREAVIKLFLKYDSKETGYIEGQAYTAMLSDLSKELSTKKHLSQQEIAKQLNNIDLNQDNRISKDELFLLMRRLNP